MDMKVLVYSNFSQKKWKKMKSPSSMRNGRFHPSKPRGKVQKMGVLYIHSPKNVRPIPKLPQKTKTKLSKNQKDWKKGGSARSLLDYGLRPAGDHWSLAGLGCQTSSQQLLVARQPATSSHPPEIGRLEPGSDQWSPAGREWVS
jgi:hypothetical protein